MVKNILGTIAVVVVCSGMALAQTVSTGGSADGPAIVTAQSGPGGGLMEGPMPSTGLREMVIRTERGPRMFFRARGMGEWWSDPEAAQKIGLSDQQKQQLEKIHQEGQLKMIDLRANLEKQEVILAPMLRTYHPDETQVLAQVDKVSQARTALERARVQTMLATRNVLTEDQWRKLQDTRMESRRTFGPRRGFHPPGMMRMPAEPPSTQ